MLRVVKRAPTFALVALGLFVMIISMVSIGTSPRSVAYADGETPTPTPDLLPAPNLISPLDGAIVNIAPTLSWEAVAGATEYEYQVADSPTFETLYGHGFVPTISQVVWPLSPATYYWRVAAVNSDQVSGPWSSVWSFTTEDQADPPPNPISPANWSSLNTLNPTFSWEAVPDTFQYYLEVSDSRSFYIAYSAFVEEPTYTFVDPIPAGVYYWRVRAFSYYGIPAPWSEIQVARFYPPALPQADCPTTSNKNYVSAGVDQYDLDDPVRPAVENADKNLAVRGWNEITGQQMGFVNYGSPSDNKMPPQIATMFTPRRVPRFVWTGRVIDWYWNPSPDPGQFAGPLDNLAVTILGLRPTSFEHLRSPKHGRNLGNPVGQGGAIVLYADPFSITLKFTREDSVATGYTMHISNICTDPNLVALYNSLDNADRNSFGVGSDNTPRDGLPDYFLPGLKEGQVFGTSFLRTRVLVTIRDMGMFLDPRSVTEWWQLQ